MEKTLEDAVVKLGSVASSTLTKPGRAMIEAWIAGERDPRVLADLSMARLRIKLPELEGAFDSRFEDHHAVQLRQLLDHIAWFDATIDALSQRIAVQTEPWAGLCPGHDESGGKRRSGRTTQGDVWLSAALTEAAWPAIRTKDTYLQTKFWRVAGLVPTATARPRPASRSHTSC